MLKIINQINSKDEMTKLERVIATLNFEATDRVAIFDLMENPGAIEYFSGEKLKSYENPKNDEYNLKLVCKAISNSLDLTRSVYAPRKNITFKNDLGFTIRQEAWTSWIEKRPFCNLKEAKEFVKSLIKLIKKSDRMSQWNYFGETGYDKTLLQDFKKIKKFVNGTVVFLSESIILTTLYGMLGVDNFSYIYLENPDIISECLEELTNHEIERVKLIADPSLSPITLVADDIAFKGGLIFPPDLLKKELFPRLKKIVKTYHDYGLKCIFHSDGNFMQVLDDLVDTGIDGVNPIEPLAGWDLIDVRERYPRLVLMGNIDVSQLLSFGTTSEVKKAVKKAIDNIYPTGGLILASSSELGPYLNPENVIVMNLFAKEYSRIKPFKPREIDEIKV